MNARRAAFALILGTASLAQAQPQGLGFRMLNDAANPFPYYIDGRSLSPTSNLNLSQIQQATDRAWLTWQQVVCNDDAFQSLGLSTNNANIADPEDPFEAFNVSTVWITDAGDPYYQYALSNGDIGSAIPEAYGGILYNCHIYLNGINFQWSVADTLPMQPGWVDLESIVLHEAGHCQGLGHTNDINDVMYAGEALGYIKRVLSPTDVTNICNTAPKSGAVGSPCQADGGCGSGTLACIHPVLPDGGTQEAVCSMACAPTSPTNQCPTPFVCRQSTLIAGSPGACVAPTAEYVTQVGKACGQNTDCGSSSGVCQLPGTLPSGFTSWQGGYCTEACGTGNLPCPATSTCVTYGSSSVCLQTCRPGLADCRPGYGCQPSVDGSTYVCVSACHADGDCAAGYVCRTCDGICLASQNPTAQLGDGCTSPANCGLGQICLGFGANPTSGICSEACGSTCYSCPGGSSCRPVGNDGTLYCLLDCPSGICPNGLSCSQTTAGPSCMPACGSAADCPVGDQCTAGRCINPFNDGGNNCQLCGGNDSGVYQGGGGFDGGNGGGGGGGGCGCQSTGGSTMVLVLVLFLFLSGAPRAWRSR